MFRRIKHRKFVSSVGEEEPDKYRCLVCGFICSKKTTRIAGERKSANKFLDGTIYTEVTSGVYKVSDDGTGCPQCHSLYSR